MWKTPYSDYMLKTEIIGAILAISMCLISPIVAIIGFICLSLYCYTD